MKIAPLHDGYAARPRAPREAEEGAVPGSTGGRVAKALATGLVETPGGAWRSLKDMGTTMVEHPVATGVTMAGTMALAAVAPVVGTVALAAGLGFTAYSVGSKLVDATRAAARARTAGDMRRASRLAGDAYGEVAVNAALFAGPMLLGRAVAGRASKFIGTIRREAELVPKVPVRKPEEVLIEALAPLAKAKPQDLIADLLVVAQEAAPAKREALLALVRSPEFLAADPGRKIVMTVETLGPAFTKLTQVAADAEGIPPELAKVLKTTQDALSPMPQAAMDAILAQEPQVAADVAKGIYRIGGQAYQLGDRLGVASVGQVHLVKDLATQETRVLKLVKPLARKEALEDEFKLMDSLVRFWAKNWDVPDHQQQSMLKNLQNFRSGVLDEVQMGNEFKNAQRFEALYAGRDFLGVKARYVSPAGDLLLMDKAEGVAFTKLSKLPKAEQDEALLAYMRGLYQQMGTGYFHADPHPGNVFWNSQTHKVQYIDMGAMAEIKPAERVQLFELIGTMLTRNPDELARYMIQHADQVTSKLPAEQLQAELGQALRQFFAQASKTMDPNKDTLAIAKIAQEHGVMPHDNGFWFTKTMITIGNVTRGPVGDKWLSELLPPMTKAVVEAARTEPAMVRSTVVNLARSIGQSPAGLAKSIVLLTNAQPDMFQTLPVALVKVLNELAAPLRVGAQVTGEARRQASPAA